MYETAFNNVVTKYDGILSEIEFQKNLLDEYISQTEGKGYIVSTEYYDALIKNEKSNIKKLKQEKSDLLDALEEAVNSKTIAEGSESWQNMVNQINDVTLAIEESNTAIIEYNNSIRDIEWSIFDLLQEKISQITDEADFLIDLMSNGNLYDDRGQLTNEGMSTMGLHGLNYNVYMAQADKYAEEILKIDKELAEDPYNQDLAERRQELLDLQQDMILAAESEKDAIKDLVSEGIELELDALQELIDKYEDALDSSKDLYDYNKKISEQTSEIASLEKQLAAYRNDNSEETRQKVQQIKVSLEDARENLEETQYDQFISDQKKLFDELYDQYSEILNSRLDDLNGLIEDMIAEINNNADMISNTLSEKAESVGYTLSSSMESIWNTSVTGITDVLTTYGNNIQGGISSAATTVNATLGAMNLNLQNMIKALNSMAATKVESVSTASASKTPEATLSSTSSSSTSKTTSTSSSTKTTTSTASKTGSGNGKPEVGDKVKFNTGLYYADSYGGGAHGSKNRGGYVYITKINTKGSYPYHVSIGKKLGSGDLGWLKLKQISGYATGKEKFLTNDIAWTQEDGQEMIVRPSDGAILTPIAKNDSILNARASNNIWDMANSPSDFIRDNLKLDNFGEPVNKCAQNTYQQNLDKVIFNLPNVKNYEELLSEMQSDKNFERLILSMTVDRIAGKSALAKGKAIR